jgi:[ribosomal protein S5]-alanine N-acetyltransferase
MNIPTSLIIETERLFLRIATPDDIPFVYSATLYPGFNDGMLWEPPAGPEELSDPHKNFIKAWEDSSAYNFSIIKKSDQLMTGRISIRRTNEDNTWNIGFWTHPKHQNQGYMSEATSAIIKFGFVTLGAEKIIACHALWNKASEKVLKKNGMIFSKYIENGFQKKGEWIEENLLEIKRTDWKG